MGTIVTVLLSNDATAVVLTPAVYAATRAARVEPLPYLFICAFIANAASFVLPISNPANLVVFGKTMPPLADWLRIFALPSVVAIAATYLALRLTQRRALEFASRRGRGDCPVDDGRRPCGIRDRDDRGGAARGLRDGLGPGSADLRRRRGRHRAHSRDRTAVAAARGQGHLVVGAAAGGGPVHSGRRVEPDRSAAGAGANPEAGTAASPQLTSWIAGIVVAVASNLANNLPVGLIAATTSQTAQVPADITGAILIGVDLGPNLSVTGSLATILWLIALRREGEGVSAWQFLKVGLVVMPPALLLSLLALAAMAR